MKIFGEYHIQTGRSYHNIGVTLIKKGDNEGALISLQKAQAIFTRE